LTLRLITDRSGVSPTAPLKARPDLGLDAHQRLFANAGAMLAIFDGRPASWPSTLPARVLGRAAGELIGTPLLDCLDPREATRLAQAVDRWPSGFVEVLARHRHSDGSWRSLLWGGSAHGTLVRVGEGRHRMAAPRAPCRPRPAHPAEQSRGVHR